MSGPVDDSIASLDRLAFLVGDVIARVERLGLLQHDDEVADRFADLVALHTELRTRWPVVLDPPVTSREQLRDRVLSVDAPARIRALALVLDEATLIAADERSQRRWDKARNFAVSALHELANLASPPSLPGPTQDPAAWFPWAWSQRSSPTWTLIEGICPDLFDFLEWGSPDGWFPADSQAKVVLASPDAEVPSLERGAPRAANVAPAPATEAVFSSQPVSDPIAATSEDAVEPRHAGGSLPAKAQGTGAKSLTKLTDGELASLFVPDAAEALKNADRLIGAAANRNERRHRERFIQSEARAELEKRRKFRPVAISETPAGKPPVPGAPLAERLASVVTRLPPPTNHAASTVSAPVPAFVPLEPAGPSEVPPPAVLPALAPVSPAGEPVRLLGFQDFSALYWTGSGSCTLAPWTRPEFTAQLNQAAEDAAIRGDHHRLQIYALAQELRGVQPLIFPADLETIRRMLWQRTLQ